VLRAGVAVSPILSSALVILVERLPLISVVDQMSSATSTWTLLAVPLVMVLRRILEGGSITGRVLAVAEGEAGHVRGGLRPVDVLASMIFAALSGSAAADTASDGSILIPTMRKACYGPAFAAALTAAASTLGVVTPPSVILIVYGALGNFLIGALLLTGLVEGLVIGLFVTGYSHVLAVRPGGGRQNPFPGVRGFGAVQRHPAMVGAHRLTWDIVWVCRHRAATASGCPGWAAEGASAGGFVALMGLHRRHAIRPLRVPTEERRKRGREGGVGRPVGGVRTGCARSGW
jgi:hypothetical protein